jgi:hypothetical protein
LSLINFGFDPELGDCYFYFNNYYLNYPLINLIDYIDYNANIDVNFNLPITFYNAVISFIDILFYSYFFFSHTLNINLKNLNGNISTTY